jgi:hypothetical protein
LRRVSAVRVAGHDSNPVMGVIGINILFTTTLLGRFDNPIIRDT